MTLMYRLCGIFLSAGVLLGIGCGGLDGAGESSDLATTTKIGVSASAETSFAPPVAGPATADPEQWIQQILNDLDQIYQALQEPVPPWIIPETGPSPDASADCGCSDETTALALGAGTGSAPSPDAGTGSNSDGGTPCNDPNAPLKSWFADKIKEIPDLITEGTNVQLFIGRNIGRAKQLESDRSGLSKALVLVANDPVKQARLGRELDDVEAKLEHEDQRMDRAETLNQRAIAALTDALAQAGAGIAALERCPPDTAAALAAADAVRVDLAIARRVATKPVAEKTAELLAAADAMLKSVGTQLLLR